MPTRSRRRIKTTKTARNRVQTRKARQPKKGSNQVASEQAQTTTAIKLGKGARVANLKPSDVLALQATMGNSAVQRLVMGKNGITKPSANGNGGNPSPTSATGAIIQRAPAGGAIVVEKTHLRKPNKSGTGPRKGPALFNYLGKAVQANTRIELLGTKVSDKASNVTWQKARHPKTGKIGFVRMNKVLAPSMGAASTISGPKAPGTVDQVGKVAATIKNIIGDGSKIGISIGSMLSAKKKSEKDLAGVMLTKPEFRDRWFQFSEKGHKDQAEALVKKDLGGIKDVLGEGGQLGFKIGDLSTGIAGEALGAFGGLIGMIKGFKKYRGKEASLGDKIEGAIGAYTGISAMVKSGTGALSKVSGFVGGVVEDKAAKTLLGMGKEFFGFLGSGIDTLKGTVETSVKFIKMIAGAVKQKGKSAGSRIKTFLEAAMGVAGSALGTIKSGIATAAGFLKTLSALPLVSSIMGIVGSVIDLVTGALDLVKSIYETIKLVVKIKKEKEIEDQLKKGDFEKTEGELRPKLERMEHEAQPSGGTPKRAVDKEGRPTVKQQETTLAKYLAHTGPRSAGVKQDAQDIQTHLMEQSLAAAVRKRIRRAYSRLPELIVDGIAASISIIGGLLSVGADIAAVATAPTGIGTAAAVATKTIASTVTSVLTASMKVGKAIYKIGRIGVRKLKQYARNKGWFGTNQEKTSEKKLARNKEATKALMLSIAKLDPKSPDFEAQASRAQLRFKAAGVDMTELFGKNGQPDEQAKLIMKALSARK